MKPSEILDAAAALIEPEGRWTQGRLAKYESGGLKAAYGPIRSNAVCWCAEGAIAHVVGSYITPEYSNAEAFVTSVIGGYLAGWNDAEWRTQAEVVAKLREAADLARSEGQ